MKKFQAGSVYIVGLIFIFLTALIAASMLLMTSIEYRHVIRDQWSLTALHLAEAGVDNAIWALKNNNWGGGWITTGNPYIKTASSFIDSTGTVIGSYYVKVYDPTASTPTIDSTGYSPDMNASDKITRTMTISLQKKNIFGQAVFGDDWVKLDSNAKTDSYDSTLGSYGGSNVGSNGDVGTNSISTSSPYAIDLDSNAKIKGDAQIGPDGNINTAITLDSNAEITGTKSAASSLQEMPSITAPSDTLPSGGSISLSGSDSQTITSNNQYSSISLNNNSSLIINTSKVYVSGNLNLDSNSQINVNYPGAVTIYVSGQVNFNSNTDLNISTSSDVTFYAGTSFHMDSNSAVNNSSQNPSKFSLLALDTVTTDIDLDSNTNIYGTIYAKNAGISIDSNAVLFGAIAAKTIKLDSNAFIHYDEAVATDANGPGYALTILYWKEK